MYVAEIVGAVILMAGGIALRIYGVKRMRRRHQEYRDALKDVDA